MKKIVLPVLVVLVFTLLLSCGAGESNNSKKDTIAETQKKEIETPVVKHTLKSAIITSDVEIMGMKKTQKTYFDEYGEKTCIELVGEFQGQKVNSRTITLGTDVYVLDMLKKTGVKSKKTSPLEGGDFDYIPNNTEVMKQLNIKKEGSETILEKTCDKYSINNEMIVGYFWIWDNIPLKIQVKKMKIRNNFTVKKLEENATVSPEMFQIPSDFKIEEQK